MKELSQSSGKLSATRQVVEQMALYKDVFAKSFRFMHIREQILKGHNAELRASLIADVAIKGFIENNPQYEVELKKA